MTAAIGNLVLTLKAGEHIQIGDITLTLVQVTDRGRAIVAIEAPKDVAITRGPKQ